MTNVIELEAVCKEYRSARGARTVALDRLDLVVPKGGVFGFLGPNGSGKTTTIRCLLGLARPTSGRCRILEADPVTELCEVVDRIGALVEAPALFPTFSGRRNLEILAAMRGIPESRVDEVLDIAGLASRARTLVKAYSLGMKQRLGIAAALLKDPELLILDEPANGLDPAGIREVRHLLRTLAREGRTILVSSHILGEVQQICDRVAILSSGRCVATGEVGAVLANGGRAGLLVRTEPAEDGRRALAEAGITASVAADGALHVEVEPASGAWVTEVLARKGVYVSEMRAHQADLETVFFELTEGVA